MSCLYASATTLWHPFPILKRAFYNIESALVVQAITEFRKSGKLLYSFTTPAHEVIDSDLYRVAPNKTIESALAYFLCKGARCTFDIEIQQFNISIDLKHYAFNESHASMFRRAHAAYNTEVLNRPKRAYRKVSEGRKEQSERARAVDGRYLPGTPVATDATL